MSSLSRVLFAALTALIVVASARASAQSRIAFAEFELQGPAAGLVLDAGLAGTTRLEGTLSAGETGRFLVPIPTSPGAPPLEPRVTTATGAVRFLGWREPDARLATLPSALRARPAPAASSTRVRVRPSVLLVLAAAGIAGLWLRRSPRAALAVGIVGTAIAFALARASLDRDAPAVEVLDGIAGSPTWQRARGARDALVLPARTPSFELRTEPNGVALAITLPFDPAALPRATATRARLVATWPEPWPEDALERGANHLVVLDEVWVREEGNWTARGPWPLGAPLGPPRPGSDPPGWLIDGLPQGVAVVVGRVAGEEWSFVRCTYP